MSDDTEADIDMDYDPDDGDVCPHGVGFDEDCEDCEDVEDDE